MRNVLIVAAFAGLAYLIIRKHQQSKDRRNDYQNIHFQLF